MKKSIAVLFVLVALVAGALVVQTSAAAPTFPEIIPVPDGWAPEGVVTGRGHTLYVGSLATGGIYEVDLRTGEGQVVVTPPEPRVAVGLGFDQRSGLLFVAGQMAGEGYVYDPQTGASVATYEFTDAESTFVNDVIVTRDAAYFTDSFQAQIYRVPLGPAGALPDPSEVETIELGGDFELVAGFNANGIEATPNGEWLIIVQSATGTLFRVDPDTGQATAIDLGGESVPAGDGILLQGRTLYVVQNQLNQIAVVELDPDLTSGTVVERLTHPAFDVPTTVAGFGPYLYAVNARFGTPVTPDTAYDVVQVRR